MKKSAFALLLSMAVLTAFAADLPLKGIASACKKLSITKSMIKKESSYLYKVLEVDKWDIE